MKYTSGRRLRARHAQAAYAALVREYFATGRAPLESEHELFQERLYRFGLERPSMNVLRDFLGKALGVEPLIRDLSRARIRRSRISRGR